MTIGNRGPGRGAGGGAPEGMGATGYSNLRDDFTATVATTKTITLASLPAWITVTAPKIVAIGQKPATGETDWDFIYIRGSGDLEISYAAGTITFDTDVLTVGAALGVWIEEIDRYQMTGDDSTPRQKVHNEFYDSATGRAKTVDAAYDSTIGRLKTRDEAYTVDTESERVEEIDPLDTRGIAETVIDETNIADGTYYRYVSMDNYRKGFFQLELDGGSGTMTVTVEATVQDEDVAPASRAYQDITLATFGVSSFTSDAILADNSEKLAGYPYIRFKAVASTGASDDADVTIYGYRLY